MQSTILCEECKEELEQTGGESSIGGIGFNTHYYCEKCQVNIDIAVRFNKTKGEKKTESDK